MYHETGEIKKKGIAEIMKKSWITSDGESSDSWENADCETKPIM